MTTAQTAEAIMQAVDRARLWDVRALLLETHGAGDYRVTREEGGYACELREHPTGCWGCFAVGYETLVEAVNACEADLRARLGGAL